MNPCLGGWILPTVEGSTTSCENCTQHVPCQPPQLFASKWQDAGVKIYFCRSCNCKIPVTYEVQESISNESNKDHPDWISIWNWSCVRTRIIFSIISMFFKSRYHTRPSFSLFRILIIHLHQNFPIRLWQNDKTSPFHRLIPATAH